MILNLSIIENEPLLPLEILDTTETISMTVNDNTEDIHLSIEGMDVVEELEVEPIFNLSYARRHPWLNT